jgi:hypothetical protein
LRYNTSKAPHLPGMRQISLKVIFTVPFTA